jgi:hypothetical protein
MKGWKIMSDASSRDTTPAWPEPTAKVPAAQRDILALWENSRPDTPVNASVLVVALQKRGHSASAAQWAIHRMIGDGRLVAEPRPFTFYPSGWQNYLNFQVRLTEKFWAWAQEPEPPRHDEPSKPGPSVGKGVSLLDAALILTEEDRPLARQKKSAWQKLRTPTLPASIGNCPSHKQVKLFAPSAIANFVEEVEGKSLCTQYKLRQRLNAKAREPRQE